jgi:hypothetical protein
MMPANALPSSALAAELEQLARKWDRLMSDEFDGHGGSPGEWMVERMDEIETELRRRSATST